MHVPPRLGHACKEGRVARGRGGASQVASCSSHHAPPGAGVRCRALTDGHWAGEGKQRALQLPMAEEHNYVHSRVSPTSMSPIVD